MNLLPGRNKRVAFDETFSEISTDRHLKTTLKRIFLSTATASSLLVAIGAIEPAAFSLATKAQAETALPPLKTISLDTVDYDQTGRIVFSGRGPAGSKVQLNVDNNTYGLAVTNDKGTWTYAFLSPIAVGFHNLRANEIGGDGAVKNRIQMLFYRKEPAKAVTAPPAPATPEAPKPAELQAAPVEKKEAIASTEQPDVKKTVKAPADEQAIPVIPKANLRDAGAESWKINCSPAFGGWSKSSQYYISTAGKRVSCAMAPKNARG